MVIKAGFCGLRRVSRIGLVVLLVAMVILLTRPAQAETVVSTELTMMAATERTGSLGFGVYNLSEGKFSLNSAGSAEVKAQLTADIKITDTVIFDITKAWVKARLAALRLTVGKTRLSWGEGFMFNAGDVIFNGKNADLSAEDLRDNNTWLTALYLPLGDFSFIEAVFLPPDLPIKEYLSSLQNPSAPKPTLASFDTSSAGGRLYTKLGGLKLEAGYLWDGADALNKPYISLQGNLGADIHLSSSIGIPANDPWTTDTPKNWEISTGLLYQLSLSSGEDSGATETPTSGSLDFRLEASVKPYGEWSAQSLALPPFSFTSDGSVESPYALSVFPQISWKSDTLFVFARGIWSPVDMSGIASLGLQWGPLQGFKILTGFSLQLGETVDVYGFDRARGWQLTLGTRVNF